MPLTTRAVRMIPRGRDGRAVHPAVRAGIVHRDRVEQRAIGPEPAGDDQRAVVRDRRRRAARGREGCARLPCVAVRAVDPEGRLRNESLAFQTADGVQRVTDDHERHVVPVRGQVRDARPRVARRIIPVRDARWCVRGIKSARNVDLSAQQRAGVLLQPHGNRRRDGPGSTRCEHGGEHERQAQCSSCNTHEWQTHMTRSRILSHPPAQGSGAPTQHPEMAPPAGRILRASMYVT